jgi:cell division septation protein DedD
VPPPLAGQPVPEGAAGPVRVQFGAFKIEDNAHQIQWAVEATGLPVEIAQLRTPKGRVLYYVRSLPFADRAAAVSAATMAQNKAKGFVNPVAIDYVIVGDVAKPAQQAQVPGN